MPHNSLLYGDVQEFMFYSTLAEHGAIMLLSSPRLEYTTKRNKCGVQIDIAQYQASFSAGYMPHQL